MPCGLSASSRASGDRWRSLDTRLRLLRRKMASVRSLGSALRVARICHALAPSCKETGTDSWSTVLVPFGIAMVCAQVKRGWTAPSRKASASGRKITDDPQKWAKAQAAVLAVRSGQLSHRKTAKQHGVRLSTSSASCNPSINGVPPKGVLASTLEPAWRGPAVQALVGGRRDVIKKTTSTDSA